MTRIKFRFFALAISVAYFALIFACIGAKLLWCGKYYDLVKDVCTFAAAFPVAVLAGAYQLRTSFLQQLRETWKASLEGVQEAIQFTFIESPKPEQFSLLMKKLSVAVDDFRSLYSNLGEDDQSIGYFPFEGLKGIQTAISSYYLGKDYSHENQFATRACITKSWKQVRKAILSEFDRPPPTRHDSPFYH